jgi:hypothetical protein
MGVANQKSMRTPGLKVKELQMSLQFCVLQAKRSGDDFVVRNGDFFSALHLIMSNKHSRLRRDETLKVR